MDEAKKQALRRRLIEELKNLKRQQKQNEHFGMKEAINSAGELSNYDNHPADLGTEMFERGKDLAFSEASERQIKEIQSALKRMEEGSYGLCRVCKEPIPEERLEAVPWASTCISHHPNPHISKGRPVEEEIIQSRKEDHRYDRMETWEDVEEYGTSNSPDFFQEVKDDPEWAIGNNDREGVDFAEGFSVTELEGEMDEKTDGS